MRKEYRTIIYDFFSANIVKIALVTVIFGYILAALNQLVPFNSVDEKMLAKWSWEMYKDPFPVLLYPPLFIYIHFVLSLFYGFFFILTGISTGYSDFLYSGDGFRFMMEAGRFVNVVAGVLIITTVYKIARRIANREAGLMSAAFMAFNPVFILHSHIFKSDIILSLLIVLSFNFILRFLNEGSNRDLALSSLLFGLAVAAKYNIIIFPVIILLVIFLRRKDGKNVKRLFLSSGFSIFGFLMGAPNWIVHPLGNLREFLNIFVNRGSTIFTLNRYSAGDIYMKFISGLKENFGLILLLILILGIIITFLKRSKEKILIILFVLAYILFFGFSGFYGNRFLLPIIPFVCLLVSTTLIDLTDKIKIFPHSVPVMKTLIWIVVTFALVNSAMVRFETFDRLRSGNKSFFVAKFRKDHNIDNRRFFVASQAFTPNFKGDIRFRKSFFIKSIKKVDPSKLQFLQVNNTYRKVYYSDVNRREKKFIDLNDFKKFHEIRREKIQDWDDDFSFYYRQNPSLKNIIPRSNMKVRLPKMFATSGVWSLLPSGYYSKIPGFGKSEKTFYSNRIYSSKKIDDFMVFFFFPGTSFDLDVSMNGKTEVVKTEEKKKLVRRVILENKKVVREGLGYVYDLEITPSGKNLFSSKHPVFYLTFEPVFTNSIEAGTIPKAFNDSDLKISGLFNSGKLPKWIIDFYRNTGVDLSLYKFMQTVNYNFPPKGYRGAGYFYPVKQKTIFVDIKGEQILEGCDFKKEGYLRVEVVSDRNSDFYEKEYYYTGKPLKIDLGPGFLKFIRITPKEFKSNNFLPDKVLIYPDITEYPGNS